GKTKNNSGYTEISLVSDGNMIMYLKFLVKTQLQTNWENQKQQWIYRDFYGLRQEHDLDSS
ncbi:MAG: hypothetical protein O4808_21475, partial [Trichodesmium sp. St17_bin3_1_1]|nr:hypothetical protein [Trichodesmium sp. St17_bin3_1_1]